MSRAEIKAKFDEIVDFSGVEKFLDTPVKRYSSGMQVRLAFAVAANLDPEILIIDEVLAVGDAEFQEKCLGKMQDVAASGRTVLFVSHNMGAVQRLCSRGVLLANGRIQEEGAIDGLIDSYLSKIESLSQQPTTDRIDRRGNGKAKFVNVSIFSIENELGSLATARFAGIRFEVDKLLHGLACSFTIYDRRGHALCHFDSKNVGSNDKSDSEGRTVPSFVCEIEQLLLQPGLYRVNAALNCSGELVDHIEGIATFNVIDAGLLGRSSASNVRLGCVALPHKWITPNNCSTQ